MRIAKYIFLTALCMFVSTNYALVSTNRANEELATETFAIVLGSEIDNENLIRDVTYAHTFLSKRLGAENVYLSTYIESKLRDKFDAKGVNAEHEASPEILKRLIEEIGERSSVGDVIFLNLDGHGGQESRLKPVENHINFSNGQTTYAELANWITNYLPGRKVKILNHLCHGGGNHQIAIDLPNVCTASGTNHEFGKSNPDSHDHFVRGFYMELEDNPNATFSEAYWRACLNDPYNSDNAKISSEVYLEVLFGKGDFSKDNQTGYSVHEYCEASMAEVYALAELIDGIEEKWKNGEFDNPADFLPEQIIAMENHLIHKELDWLKELCGSQEWQELKKSYAKGVQALEKAVKKQQRKQGKEKFWSSREEFEDLRSTLETEFYPLVLARKSFNKIESLNLLFSDDRLVEERGKYLNLVECENRPIFPIE